MPVSVQEFSDAHVWAAAVAQALVADLTAALARKPSVRIALAGGGTPRPIYAALGALDLDWPCVEIVPTDDRLVPEDHPARNLAALRAGLRPALVAGAHLTPLEALDGPVALDAVLLGFGLDGHVASLFPDTEESATPVGAGLVRVTPRPLPPEAPFPRISLTLCALKSAPRLCLAAAGPHKREVFEAARAPQAGSPLAELLRSDGVKVVAFFRQ